MSVTFVSILDWCSIDLYNIYASRTPFNFVLSNFQLVSQPFRYISKKVVFLSDCLLYSQVVFQVAQESWKARVVLWVFEFLSKILFYSVENHIEHSLLTIAVICKNRYNKISRKRIFYNKIKTKNCLLNRLVFGVLRRFDDGQLAVL